MGTQASAETVAITHWRTPLTTFGKRPREPLGPKMANVWLGKGSVKSVSPRGCETKKTKVPSFMPNGPTMGPKLDAQLHFDSVLSGVVSRKLTFKKK